MDLRFFDEVVDRRSTYSHKWNVPEDGLPMWVADMDFKVAPCIVDAIRKRTENEIYGYSYVPGEYGEAFAEWWNRRHGTSMKPEWVLFCGGVVPAISSMIRQFSDEGDGVLLLTPVYNNFFDSVLNNRRSVWDCELLYENGEYRIDYEALERGLREEKTKICLFCNPHNPIGKIWSLEELERVAKLCAENDVLLISDEIHCDLTHRGFQYCSALRMDRQYLDRLIVCVAPSKTFNIAGLHTSGIVVPNENLRAVVRFGFTTSGIDHANVFSTAAAIAAFKEGEPWLEALSVYLEQSREMMGEYISKNLSELQIVRAQASYLSWVDCTKLTDDASELAAFVQQETGLKVSPGEIYGKAGKSFFRFNYACPHSLLRDGLERLKKGVEEWKRKNAR